jgi:hypothetical protein
MPVMNLLEMETDIACEEFRRAGRAVRAHSGPERAPMRFLEIFKSSYFADVSLDQWMALTPPELVEAHLKLDHQVMDGLRRDKAPVVPA